MKKLTAGIFATLLAVVSVSAAHAEIASKGYVDQQVGTKADAATVTSLQGTVSGHTSQIGTINDTIGGYGDIVTHDASEFATTGALTSGLAGKLDTTGTAARATADASGNVITTTYATKAEIADLATDENLALKQDKTDEGLETTNKTVVGAINEVRGTANTASSTATAAQSAASAAQADATQALEDAATAQSAAEAAQTAADSKLPTATYNTQVGTVNATNMGTTASTVVTAIKEVAGEAAAAASAASAADTKAGQAQTAATAAQGDVDALEAVVNNGTTGLAAAHTAIDALESGKLDKTGTAARATADASGNEITKTYATKAEIADLATDENLALKQDKTDNNLATTNKTVVGAINEVRGTANTASSTATAAQSAAAAAQADADQALEDAATAQSAAEAAQTAADSKLPTATYNTQVGTVSATNMGTTASTVVTAIKEVAGEASAAQSAASAADSKAQAAQSAAEAADSKAQAAQTTANAAIPAPDGECTNGTAKCVLTFNNSVYAWEVIARDGEGE